MSHDYDWKEKHEKERSHWPTGSLERTLLRDGTRSLSEAVKKRMNSKQDGSPPEVPFENFLYERTTEAPEITALRSAIKELELVSKGFDYSTVSQDTLTSLANMPLDTMEAVELWMKAWLDIFKKTPEPFVW